MARLEKKAELVTNNLFNNRVAMAAAVVAVRVTAEDPHVWIEKYQTRINYAMQVIQDPLSYGRRMTAIILINDAVTDLALIHNPTNQEIRDLDDALEAELYTRWNNLSGIAEYLSLIHI